MRNSRLLPKTIFLLCLLPALIYNPLSARLFTLTTAWLTKVDLPIFYRLIKAESSFRSLAYSHQKAIGLGQMKRSTYQYIMPEQPQFLIWFPPSNLLASARYLQYLNQKYRGNWSLAVAAYNWGETNVDKRLAQVSVNTEIDYREKFLDIPETDAFLDKVLGKKNGEEL
ncbi:MAG: lytic transglycosylase domain-containing protein [Candidatus Cloacimonadales bacterium]